LTFGAVPSTSRRATTRAVGLRQVDGPALASRVAAEVCLHKIARRTRQREGITSGTTPTLWTTLDGPIREVRLLVDHREDLVAARTQMQNRLRWHLHELEPGREPGPRSLDRYCELDRLAVWLASCEQSVLVRLAGEPVRDIRPPGSPTSRDGTRCYPPTSRTGVRDEEVAGFNYVTPTTSNGLVSGS